MPPGLRLGGSYRFPSTTEQMTLEEDGPEASNVTTTATSLPRREKKQGPGARIYFLHSIDSICRAHLI